MKRAAHFFLAGLLLTVSLSAVSADSAVVGDIVFERKVKGSDEIPPSIFRHWVHRVIYKCTACHNPKVGFKLKAGETPITMDAIQEGKYCGECHKGKPAFAVSFETCERCHRS